MHRLAFEVFTSVFAIPTRRGTAKHHKCVDRARLSRTIPLVVHCDRVEVYSNTEVNIWSLSSALASGHVNDVKFPFLAVAEEDMNTPTLRKAMHAEVCKFVAWSLEHCFSGIFPTSGFYGEDGCTTCA